MTATATANGGSDGVASGSLPALKYLGPVQDAATYAWSYTSTADSLYKRVKNVAPASLQPTIANAEATVVQYATPVVTRAIDVAGKALVVADEKVEYGFKTVSSVRQVHEANVKTFNETSKAYFAYVQQLAGWASEHLDPVKGGRAALDTLNGALTKAQEATDPDVAVKLATDAWAKFAAIPVVAKVLETADPVTKTALASFTSLHDSLVRMVLYKRLVDSSASTLAWATQLPPYKLGAAYLYPFVQPVADPALSKLAGSKVVKDTLDYWRPTASVA